MALPEDPGLRIVTDAQFDGHAHAWGDVTDKPATYPPTGHADSHGIGGSDPVTPASIGALAADDPRLRDTGWRLLTLINGWTANGATAATAPAFRRIGKAVYIRVRNLDGSAATSSTFAVLPAGFQPPSADGGIVMMGTSLRVAFVASNGNAFISNGNGQTGSGAPTSFIILTESAFPAEPYPSTPA